MRHIIRTTTFVLSLLAVQACSTQQAGELAVDGVVGTGKLVAKGAIGAGKLAGKGVIKAGRYAADNSTVAVVDGKTTTFKPGTSLCRDATGALYAAPQNASGAFFCPAN